MPSGGVRDSGDGDGRAKESSSDRSVISIMKMPAPVQNPTIQCQHSTPHSPGQHRSARQSPAHQITAQRSTAPHHSTAPQHRTAQHSTPYRTTPHQITTPHHHTTPHASTRQQSPAHRTTPHHTTPQHSIPHHSTAQWESNERRKCYQLTSNNHNAKSALVPSAKKQARFRPITDPTPNPW
jgi:hypothetical protein